MNTGYELVAEIARVEMALASSPAPIDMPSPPERSAFARAQRVFRLDAFERWVLTLSAAAELEPRVPLALARRADNLGQLWPTLGFAAQLVPHGERGVLERINPLRSWGLVDVDGAGPLPGRTVRLGPGVGGLLLQEPHADLDPACTLDQLQLPATIHAACAEIAARLRSGEPLAVVIAGEIGSGRDALAAALAATAGVGGIARSCGEQLETVRQLLRDAAWHEGIAIVRDPPADVRSIANLARAQQRALILIGRPATAVHLAEAGHDGVIAIEVPRPSPATRTAMWSAAIPEDRRAPDLDVASIGRRFRLGPSQIAAAARLARAAPGARRVTAAVADAACRTVSISSLDLLAERLERSHTLADLVVAPSTRRELELAIAWAKSGGAVFAADGIGAALDRGPGLACLFHGPSGTGKTLAARVLGNAIGLDVYRVDLSQVMDKYIGETEKRLERLFTEAERGNAILFFDEADVLFAKRTEISDARDRYANLETGYLLQRMECHPGIVILATNLRDNIDAAFLRRIHVIAELPQPRAPEREAIWRRLMPASHNADVDLSWLAQRFALTGGEINNAIATSLLLAASRSSDVAMVDLVFGVWREVGKSGRLVEAAQFGPWADQVIELAGGTHG